MTVESIMRTEEPPNELTEEPPRPWQGRAVLFQAVVLLATVAVIIGLFLREELTLLVLWNVVIPLLPASFLISPSIWRAVCPLATVNMIGNGLVSERTVSRSGLYRAEIVSILLLFVLVSARRFSLNQDGAVLGTLIVILVVAALVLGFLYSSKIGFCNTICPVLPVEKLYGQRPILDIRNPRCRTCNLCTVKGCIDLDPAKAIGYSMSAGHGSKSWLLTPFGVFAASIPGFIIGYFSTQDTVLSAFGSIYLHILGFVLASFLIVAAVTVISGASANTASPILGGLSAGFYYWYTGPAIATAFDADPVIGTGIRVIALLLVGYWLQRAIRDMPSAQETNRDVPVLIPVPD